MKNIYGIVFLLFTVYLMQVSCSNNLNNDKRPNVILIMADDLGYETIGANGGTSYSTPNIDKLAEKGMRFENCFAQPLCTPSRVKLMTGISNIRNYVRFRLLDSTQTTFGNLFRNSGYKTCIIGKWQLGKTPGRPFKAGFDNYCLWQYQGKAVDSTGRDTRYSKPQLQIDGEMVDFNIDKYGPEIVSQYGIDFIEKCAEEGTPFLLYYPMILPHCPFSPTPHSAEWETDDTTVMRYKGKAHYFNDMVFIMDSIVGAINLKLEQLGIEENTILIFTGDNGTDRPIVSMLNGEEIVGSKGKTTDAGTRVPLVASWPGKIKPSAVNNELIDFSDFFPTICQVAGIDVPDSINIDGESFYGQLIGDSLSGRKWIYSWFSRNGKEEKAKAFARTREYKLYGTGEFYNVSVDSKEKDTLSFDKLIEKEKEIYYMLDSVLVNYSTRRLECIP